MIHLIIFALLALLILDHNLKNRRFCFLYYKNNHRFSVAVVIRYHNESLERLFEIAKSSHHDFIFINVNQAIDEDVFKKHQLKFENLETKFNPRSIKHITEIQSQAYQLAYPLMDSEFLLFMDGVNEVRKVKTIDFMANNLVEHQLFSVKEVVERKGVKDAPSIYFDLYKDMNLEKNNANYYFFAIKKNTYELAKCHLDTYKTASKFEDALFKKNIHIIMVDHGQAIVRSQDSEGFRSKTKDIVNYIHKSERLLGTTRLVLFLAILHVYYASIVLYAFGVVTSEIPYVLITLGLFHVLLWLSIREYAKHSAWSYVLAPLTLYWFDIILIIALLKRKFGKNNDELAAIAPSTEIIDEAPLDEEVTVIDDEVPIDQETLDSEEISPQEEKKPISDKESSEEKKKLVSDEESLQEEMTPSEDTTDDTKEADSKKPLVEEV
ncbi:hypothetical protein [Liberiplasma polymorphum]|uniref:hypothetical protein n=1 Tax=Liberiplasma polymorphum TaxID=3374570 RepID=UPI003772F4A4